MNTAAANRATRRYQLVVPEELFVEVQMLASKRGTTVIDILRRFIRLGLMVARTEDSPDGQFIIREGDSERQVILL